MDVESTRLTLEYGALALTDGSVPWEAQLHPGLDLVSDDIPLVRTIRGGLVIRSRTYGEWGKYIVVKQEDGLYCIYAHLASLAVSEGETVAEDTVIGVMGSSGYATAAHLHIELQENYYDPYSHVDVAYYLGIKNVVGYVGYL